MTTRVEWQGVNQVKLRMRGHAENIQQAVWTVAQIVGPKMEAYAKENAPWTDRTANARQSLYHEIQQMARDAVVIYLAHGVEYGIYLETRWSGRYAIIYPTIEAHLTEIKQRLDAIFR